MIFLCRLSEYEDWNVLLLEAGGHEPDLSDVPAFSSVLKGSNIDRQYVSQNENVSCGGKPCPVPRGIVLGGISTINAMLYVRGSPEGYDHWAELGNFLLKGKVVCLFVCLFVFGATAPSGPGPPHSRGFWITHNDAPELVQPL